VTISATHGRRVNVLLEAIENLIGGDVPGDDAADPDEVTVSFVGRPNVGKSSLVNRLLGEDRMIVSAVPGTTRDTVDTRFAWNGRPVSRGGHGRVARQKIQARTIWRTSPG
jgi:GTP-binding protein